jgi:hypothetical protein
MGKMEYPLLKRKESSLWEAYESLVCMVADAPGLGLSVHSYRFGNLNPQQGSAFPRIKEPNLVNVFVSSSLTFPTISLKEYRMKIKAGMLVIPISLEKTRRKYGSAPGMQRAINQKKKLKVQSPKYEYEEADLIKAGGWYWDPKDLQVIITKKQVHKPIHFSPEMLME